MERAKTRILQGMEPRMANSQQVGAQPDGVDREGDWRLLFLNYDQHQAGHASGSRPRRQGLLQGVQPHRGRFHSRRRDPIATDVPGRVRHRRRCCKDYKTGLSCRAGEAFDPSPANIEKRLVRATLPNGMKLAMLLEGTRGGRGHGDDPAAVRRREIAGRHERHRRA